MRAKCLAWVITLSQQCLAVKVITGDKAIGGIIDDAFISRANGEIQDAVENARMLKSAFQKEELCDRAGYANTAAFNLVLSRDWKFHSELTAFDLMDFMGDGQTGYNSTHEAGYTVMIDNLGFVSDDEKETQLAPLPVVEKADNRLPDAMFPLIDALGLKLYHFMATDGLSSDAIFGKRVLEVGCGRGKGIAYLAQKFKPKACFGVDLNQKRIELARKYWGRTSNLEFLVGNSMSLPFQRDGFDIVFNVESSFHYPNFTSFVGEVFRVLKPGGLFVWTAPLLNRGDTYVSKQRVFETAGFRILKHMDITRNVVSSRDRWVNTCSSTELNLACATLLHDFVNSPLKSPLNLWEGFALPGSRQYQALSKGDVPYLRFIAEKPVAHRVP